MPRIVPHLWFDHEAFEAAEFYTGLLPDSRILYRIPLHDTPSGEAELVAAELAGQEFFLLSAGPPFKFTPAISFLIACESAQEVDHYVNAFLEGGSTLMPLDAYPFADRYAWVADRFGLSWQVMYRAGSSPLQRITPTLMFVGDAAGRAEEAVGLYASLFSGAVVGEAMRYGEGQQPDKAGTVAHLDFTLVGHSLAVMDSAHQHLFGFNEAISLLVECDSQQEIDELWSGLSASAQDEACGWLKDKFGVSWQISHAFLRMALLDPDEARANRVMQAQLKMKKFDIAELRRVWGE